MEADNIMSNELELIKRAGTHSKKIAIRSDTGEHTYANLLDRSASVACSILSDEDDLEESRIAFLATDGYDYVSIQWGIWRAGGVSVPL